MILFLHCISLALLVNEIPEEIDVQLPIEITQIGEDGFPIIVQ